VPTFGFYACVAHYKNISQYMTKLTLNYQQFLFKYEPSKLAKILDCSHTLYLAESSAQNSDMDSNLQMQEAAICSLPPL
jgi:hypothetical protein